MEIAKEIEKIKKEIVFALKKQFPNQEQLINSVNKIEIKDIKKIKDNKWCFLDFDDVDLQIVNTLTLESEFYGTLTVDFLERNQLYRIEFIDYQNDVKKKKEKKSLIEFVLKEGDELRKSLLDKLFNLNTLLSAVYLVLFQLNDISTEVKILNFLPIVSVLIILFYQLNKLLILGEIYNQVDNDNIDYQKIHNIHKQSQYFIYISIILTTFEIIYLVIYFLR
ncbi:MAG: hypothetical protein Q4C98_08380 [Capnocytophaga sp.]|nr:hypothetical protein [Capnocytophaga sp.]